MHACMFCIGKVFIIKTVNSSLVSLTRTHTEHMDMVPGCLLLDAYLSAAALMGKNIPLPYDYYIVITTNYLLTPNPKEVREQLC